MLTAIGSPELAIPEIVRERQIDLVMMSTHGGGASSALLGNVALRTVQRSLAPVLLMHAPAEVTAHSHHHSSLSVEERRPLFVAFTPAEATLVIRALHVHAYTDEVSDSDRQLAIHLTDHLQELLKGQ
jgi:hypothetical protein